MSDRSRISATRPDVCEALKSAELPKRSRRLVLGSRRTLHARSLRLVLFLHGCDDAGGIVQIADLGVAVHMHKKGAQKSVSHVIFESRCFQMQRPQTLRRTYLGSRLNYRSLESHKVKVGFEKFVRSRTAYQASRSWLLCWGDRASSVP